MVTVKIRRGIRAIRLALVVAGLGAGCSARHDPAPPAPLPALAILETANSNSASAAWRRELFPDALILPATANPREALTGMARTQILLLPEASRVPMNWWKPLQDRVERGQPVLFWGQGPFSDRAQWTNGVLQTQAEIETGILAHARSADPFSNIRAWPHLNNQDNLPGPVRVAPSGEAPWPAVWIETERLDRWDALCYSNRPDLFSNRTENALALYAAGSDNTTRLWLELEEDAGARWGTTLAVGPGWTPYLIHPARLRYLGGGRLSPRALRDGFRLSHLSRLFIGLSALAHPQAPGRRTYGVSDVRLVQDVRSGEELAHWPEFPPGSPPARTYAFTAAQTETLLRRERQRAPTGLMQSPFPRSTGLAEMDSMRIERWRPLCSALGSGGERLGYPASLYFVMDPGKPLQRTGWLAVDANPDERQAIEPLLMESLRTLAEDRILAFAGCSQLVYPASQPLQIITQWQGPAVRAGVTRIAAELWRTDDEQLLRRVVVPARTPSRPLFINMGTVPAPSTPAPPGGNAPADTYRVRTILEDSTAPGQALDVIEQFIKVFPEPSIGEKDWVTTSGARFMYQKLPLFMLGLRYEPPSLENRPRGHWLDRAGFDAERVRRDFERFQKTGLNAVWIRAVRKDQAPALRFVVDEAARRGLRILLSCPALDAINPDWDEAMALLSEADVFRSPTVFAIEIRSPQYLGSSADRARWDAEWRTWLQEQYGSVAAAERAFHRPVWQSNGQVTGPPDDQLVRDGDHRLAVAAYRRFADDLVSRRVGWLRRQLMAAGSRAMLTAAFDAALSPFEYDALFPLDPAVGAAHYDFLTLNLAGLPITPEAWGAAGFDAAYARGATGGKPILWRGAEVDVGLEPRVCDLDTQRRALQLFFNLVLKTRAAGCLAVGWPGGWNEQDRKDIGLAAPDGRWRPAGMALRAFPALFRADRALPVAWQDRTVDRGLDARGYSALAAQWRPIYARELAGGRMEELRSSGQVQLNAEWGRLLVNGVPVLRRPGQRVQLSCGQTLRAEVLNTGSDSWAPVTARTTSRVWVEVATPRGQHIEIPLRPARFGESDWINWTPADVGSVVLRCQEAEGASFGEALRLEVADDIP